MTRLPSHVPIFIDPKDIKKINEILLRMGYQWTWYQIRRPGQVLGLIKQVKHLGLIVDHHVRCFTNGKIVTEVELPRLDEMWLHLTSLSISAHERVIAILEKECISYKINKNLREYYANHEPSEFARDYLDFLRWLFYGVIFWSPLGFIWQFIYFKVRRKTLEDL